MWECNLKFSKFSWIYNNYVRRFRNPWNHSASRFNIFDFSRQYKPRRDFLDVSASVFLWPEAETEKWSDARRVRGSLDSQTRRIGTFKLALWFAAFQRNCLKQDYTIIPACEVLGGPPREIRFAFRQCDALWCKDIRRSRGIFSRLVNLVVPEGPTEIFVRQSIVHFDREKRERRGASSRKRPNKRQGAGTPRNFASFSLCRSINELNEASRDAWQTRAFVGARNEFSFAARIDGNGFAQISVRGGLLRGKFV